MLNVGLFMRRLNT